jgi:hypothetical protein
MKRKSIPKMKQDLQVIFNSYIRLRDKDKPCISCGEFKPNMQAGHFYSVRGYDGLRFNEFNVHAECPRCNLFDEMHLLNYASNLPGRIGKEGCEALGNAAAAYKRDGHKWSRSELEALTVLYKHKLKELENG